MDNFIKSSRFIEYNNSDGSKTIIDKENNYTINYTENDGYIAYNNNGDEVYHIYPDGRTSFIVKNYNKEAIVSNKSYTIENINPEMEITDWYGNKYYISNGVLKELDCWDLDETKRFYDENGIIREVTSHKTRYYNKEGREYKSEDSVSTDIYAKADGIEFDAYLINDGTYYTYNSDKHEFEISGKYTEEENGNIIFSGYDGTTIICDDTGSIIQKITKDGTVYEYNATNPNQTYSLANHIEYDEENYNTILTTLNNIGDSYVDSINNTCSSIERNINSFPDNYSGSNINSMKSNVIEHINLITLLSEMTNYSLLAYQICDEELRNGLYLLVDSLFGDGEKVLANKFKEIISNTIEDRDGDNILEYKKNTEFKTLSESAIVNSTIVDNNGNKWYLNKNGTVIGIEGNDIKINYGSEIFSLSYDENGVIILRDSNGNNLNIFGDYNINSLQYGGNQMTVVKSLNNPYVINVINNYFPNATTEEKMALLNRATNTGCGYTAMTNFVFKYFEGNEEGFYDTFGFPMYTIKSNKSDSLTIDYNYEPVITDLFCAINSEGGVYDIYCCINGDGADDYRVSNMSKYLNINYGIKLDEAQQKIQYVSDRRYKLYNLDGSLYFDASTLSDGGPHAMTIVEENEKGQSIVSTWGEKLIYEPGDSQNFDKFYSN